MVNIIQTKARLLRVFIITLLILPVIFPKHARAMTLDISAGTIGVAPRSRENSGLLAPLAGILPSGTNFLPSLLVNTIDTSAWIHPSSDPAGIVYQASTGKLLISDIDVEETPQTYWDGFNIFQSTLTGSLSGNCTTFTSTPLNPNSYNNFSDEPAGITINNSNNRIYFSDDNSSRIFEVAPGLDGAYCTSDDVVTYVALGGSPFNLTDLEDLTYGQGKLYITSAGDGSKSIYEYSLGANGVLGGGDDSSGPLPGFSTVSLGFGDPEGIAYNSNAGTLYILSNIGSDAYIGETTTSGTLLKAYDLTYLGPASRSGLAIAPASGDPSTNNIYIVSRGADNDSTLEFNDGKIWEIDITNPVMPDEIFKDGFESGSLSSWTTSTTNGGNLNVEPSAALFGSYGLRAQISSATGMEVTDDRPTLEKRYRARFYFDPNSISLGSDTHTIFQANTYDPYTSSAGSYNTTVFSVQFRFNTGTYQIRVRTLLDGGGVQFTNWFNLTDVPHFIELDWSAATAAGANNGYFTLWLDDAQSQSLINLDNDTRVIDRARLGPSTGLVSTNGTYYFDAFESRRQSSIGSVVSPTVLSVVRANSNPTSSASANYDVTFSESVTGVDISDFQITSTGVTGATVSGVSGSGAVYTVTVNLGTGLGSLRLNVIDDNSIKDSEGNFLEGGFTNGETYTIVEGAEIAVNIAEINVGNYDIPVHTGDQHDFPGIDNGPVRLVSTNAFPILPTLRVIWKEPGPRMSYSEMIGLPAEQLSTEYWFPWYNNVNIASMEQGFRIGNLDSTSRTIQIWMGTTQLDSFTLDAGASARKNYNVDNGPIRIVCSDCTASGKIIAALRVIWKEPGYRTSYSEMMGLPKEQLSDEYWFPWYNNATTSMEQGFRIGNLDSASRTIQIWMGTTQLDSFTLDAGASARKNYNVDNGPIRIVCSDCTASGKIIAALRVIWKEPGYRTSYSEMMGLPKEQLSDEYWFSWYDNASTSMDQGLRIANTDSAPHVIQIWMGTTQLDSFSLGAGGSVRKNYNVDTGPIHVICTDCFSTGKIIAALRVIWKEPGYRSSYSEMIGLPGQALSTEYWFPWYNFAAPNAMDQKLRISVP